MVADLVHQGNGVYTGTLEIDEGTLLGVQKIEAEGDAGSQLLAFVGDDTDLSPDTRRAILARATQSMVPLAQTFFVEETRLVGAIGLKLVTKGAAVEDIIVQIRKTQGGEPTDDIIAEATIDHASLVEDWQDWVFPPALLLKDIEYAICVITQSTEHKFALAKLGGIDTLTGDSVTQQSFKRGILLSSSNGINYTEHQTEDLAFRVKACNFTSTTKTVDLGNVTGLTDISDLAILGGIEIPDRDCSVEFILTDPDAIEYNLDKDQVLILPNKKTGDFNLQARLTGTNKLSPVLFNNSQLIAGEVQNTGTYVSRMLATPASFDVTVKVEVRTQNSGSVGVSFRESDGVAGAPTFQDTPLTLQPNTELTSDGWEYRIYKASSLTAYNAGSINGGQALINLGATANGDRAFVRNITVSFNEA